jgi:LuxR family transcriptional regulator, maltose regulon positive regulatory protein
LEQQSSIGAVDASPGDGDRDVPWSFTQPVLEAKYTVPRVRPGMVPRARILERLAALGEKRCIWMAAPAGYGKTTALAQWADREQRRVAWLSLDHSDDDPAMLLTDVLAALGRVEPLDPALYEMVAAAASPVPELAVLRVSWAFAGYTAPTLLVLDDAQALSNDLAREVLARLIERLPDAIQVAVATRDGHHAHLARLRLLDAVAELGRDDLSLDELEAAEVVRLLGRSMDAAKIRDVVQRSEGWPAAVYLAGRAARSGRSAGGGSEQDVSGRDRQIAAYIGHELLAPHSNDDLAFMTRTAILDQLSGPLCDAVVGKTGSAKRLAALSEADLFVIPLGGDHGWYRYHTLLREFLLAELEGGEPDDAAALHRRAAVWHAEHGSAATAIDHALHSGDLEFAAPLLARYAAAIFREGLAATVDAWFRSFDEARLLRVPYIATFGAWFYALRGDAARAERLAAVAERASYAGRPPDGTASLDSSRSMVRALMAPGGIADALQHAERASILEAPPSPWRTTALALLGGLLAVSGRPEADRVLAEVTATQVERTDVNSRVFSLAMRALIAMEHGDWHGAETLAAQSRAAAGEAIGPTAWASMIDRVACVRVDLHRGDIHGGKAALASLSGARAILTAGTPWYSVRVLLEISRCYLALSDPAGARAVLADAERIQANRDLGRLSADLVQARRVVSSLPLGIGGASTLTTAELRVLQFLPTYLTFPEIAARLVVSVATVRTQAKSIYGKLGAVSRSEAVEHAVAAGLLDPLTITSFWNVHQS